MRKFRLATVASHPVQYRAPLYRRLAREAWLDLSVFYCHDYGLRPQTSTWGIPNFSWDTRLGDGYRWRQLRNLSPRPSVHKFFGEINPGIAALAVNSDFDALLVDNWAYATSAAVLAIGAAGIKPVLLMAETRVRDAQAGSGLKQRLLGEMLRRVDAVLAIGTKNREFFLNRGVSESRIFPCPYTVDVQRFFEAAEAMRPERAGRRAALGYAPTDVVFLYVGQMIPRKRPLELCQVFHDVAAQVPTARLLMVGTGPLEREARSWAQRDRRIQVVGFRNQTELPAYYSMADAFVLLSSEETWGLVVNEALCFSLPVVVTSAMGCVYDLVSGRGSGIVVDAEQVQDWHEAMLRIALRSDERRAFGEHGRRVIEGWTYEEDASGIHLACASLAAWRRSNA